MGHAESGGECFAAAPRKAPQTQLLCLADKGPPAHRSCSRLCASLPSRPAGLKRRSDTYLRYTASRVRHTA
eukprot:2316519-Pleurochrysis_carterae.AAC.1